MQDWENRVLAAPGAPERVATVQRELQSVMAVQAYSWACDDCGSTGLCWSASAAFRGLAMHSTLMHQPPQVVGQMPLPHLT